MDQLVRKATAPPASASGKPKLINSELNKENTALNQENAESSDNNDDCDDGKDTDSTSSDKRSIEGGGGKKQVGVYIVRCRHQTEWKRKRDGIRRGFVVCTKAPRPFFSLLLNTCKTRYGMFALFFSPCPQSSFILEQQSPLPP